MGAGSIPRIGGHLALDFANTAGWHASDERSEWLTSVDEWIAWVRQSKIVAPPALSRLESEAARDPSRAKRALAAIIDHREVIYRVFTAVAARRAPTPDDLDRLHRARVVALDTASVAWERGAIALRWETDPPSLLMPLNPIVLAAVALLESPPLDRLRQCGNHPCGWLFIDQSKNGSRRWCSSDECGNASRVREFRARRAKSS